MEMHVLMNNGTWPPECVCVCVYKVMYLLVVELHIKNIIWCIFHCIFSIFRLGGITLL